MSTLARAAIRCGCTLILILTLSFNLSAQAQHSSTGDWKFAVSGDSRNCGDIVMPAIAAGVRADGAAFYWHLGDYRAMSNFDEDYRKTHPQASISKYFADAWPDFIQHQLTPFGDLPVFLEIGNHELVAPKTRGDYLAQFADWLNQPVIQRQRLADNPSDYMLKTYYHWIDRGVDFISMDNASADMFDAGQMSWIKKVLANDAKNSAIRSVVLGMHAALPDSSSAGHSMNDSAQEQETGRKVYAQLSAFRKSTGKNVYVLASHSHFVMNNVYNSACHKDDVLDGWIMGSAGAVRYRLPSNLDQANIAMTRHLRLPAGDGCARRQDYVSVQGDQAVRRAEQCCERVFAGSGEVVLRAEHVEVPALRPNLRRRSAGRRASVIR